MSADRVGGRRGGVQRQGDDSLGERVARSPDKASPTGGEAWRRDTAASRFRESPDGRSLYRRFWDTPAAVAVQTCVQCMTRRQAAGTPAHRDRLCARSPVPFRGGQVAARAWPTHFLARGCPRAASPPADTPFIWFPRPRRAEAERGANPCFAAGAAKQGMPRGVGALQKANPSTCPVGTRPAAPPPNGLRGPLVRVAWNRRSAAQESHTQSHGTHLLRIRLIIWGTSGPRACQRRGGFLTPVGVWLPRDGNL